MSENKGNTALAIAGGIILGAAVVAAGGYIAYRLIEKKRLEEGDYSFYEDCFEDDFSELEDAMPIDDEDEDEEAEKIVDDATPIESENNEE